MDFSFSGIVDDAKLAAAFALDVTLGPIAFGASSADVPLLNTAWEAEKQNALRAGRAPDPERARLSAGLLTPEEKAKAEAENIPTGLAVIEQAATDTSTQVEQYVDKGVAAAQEAVTRSGKVLEFLTRPWVLTAAGVVIVAAIAGPYLIPVVRKAFAK